MFSYLINKIVYLHNVLVTEPVVTESFLNSNIKKSITEPSLENYLKSLYASGFYLIYNTFGLLFNLKNTSHLSNKKYIKNIIDYNQIEPIEKELMFSRNFLENTKIVKKNQFMKEIIEKTEKITEKDLDGYHDLTRYVSGYCWFNAKLSHGFKITEDEEKVINSINSLVDRVEPLSYPITLFHGFEYYTSYGNYEVGSIVNLKGFVSKTLSFNIAYQFAFSQNQFNPKILVINYPPGSKHIHHDIRPFSNEFEYITKTDEKFIVKKIISYYDIQFPTLTPTFITFYICEPV